MNLDNKWVVLILKDFIKSIPLNQRYFCIGSISLLSFTKNNFSREIKDIDIICDISNFEIIKNNLKKLNYKQYTFINKRFPFYKQLSKLTKSKYFRFEKNGKSLEIMTTDFGSLKSEISVEIYPGIKFSFPLKEIISSTFDEVNIKTVSPEILYCIYSLGLKTWGRLVRKDVKKRKVDLEQLAKVINRKKLTKIANSIFLKIKKIKLKIPSFLLK